MVLSVLLATACGRERAPTVETGPTITISVDDGAPKQTVVPGPIALKTLVDPPPAAWLELHATASAGRTLELTRPATLYPDTEVRLYLDQGRAALGVFRAVTPDMPAAIAEIARQPVVSLAGITEVQLATHPPPVTALVVSVDGQERPVGELLASLPKPRASTPRERGWQLADVVALAVPRERAIRAVRVIGAGTVTPIDTTVLALPGAVIKRDRHGQYVFRVWDTENKPSLEVRGVTKIEIE